MPRRTAIGLLPATMLRVPSRRIARASTVAVVVPSPASDEVLSATSCTSLAPMFSNGSSSSISLLTVTPSLVTVGPPNDLLMITLRPRGAERDRHRVGQLIDAREHLGPRGVVEHQLLCHG